MLLNRNFSLVFILCILAPCLFAQTIVLTLDEAINLVKKNNPTISINKINEEIARMQVYKANVGMTPNLDWNFNANSSFNYVNQQFFDGRNINRFGRAIAPNTNLALSYPIYDGGLMKTRLQILEEEANRVKISNADIEEQLVDAVIQNYYLMSRQQAAIDFLKSNMNYYNERLKITSERWNLGKGSKLDYLQSQNDYNTQQTTIQSAEVQLKSLMIQLNLLLNRDPNTQFGISSFDQAVNEYVFEDAMKQAETNSEELSLVSKNLDINALRVKEVEASNKPRVNLLGTIGYVLSNTNAGLILLNQNLGTNIGFSAVWNLYDGGQNKRQTEIAKYRAKGLFAQRDQISQTIKSQLTSAFQQWQASRDILILEENNKKIAEENLQIAQEKFLLGASTILEVNDAQERNNNAANRHLNALYNVKFAALEIERVTR